VLHYEMGKAGNHTRWTFSTLRFVSSLLKEKLRREGIWEDFAQELYATSFIAWQKEMSRQETWRYAKRQIHAFLKAYGYKPYRNGYIKMDNPFAGVFRDWQVDNLASPEYPADRLVRGDPVGDNYLKEHVVNVLKRKPEGMTRKCLARYVQVSVKELQWYLDSLVKDKRLIEVKRESYGGYPPTPLYFIAGAQIPEQKKEKTEKYAEIRRLYYEERKSRKQIAREHHHSLRTIHRAIHSDLAPIAAAGKRELVPI